VTVDLSESEINLILSALGVVMATYAANTVSPPENVLELQDKLMELRDGNVPA